MSAFMEINTELSLPHVLEHLWRGHIGPIAFKHLRQASNGWWGGEWEQGTFSIRQTDERTAAQLSQEFRLPPTFRTTVWMAFDDLYEGQTPVYQMIAAALKEWSGNLAVLNNGEDLRLQRVEGRVSLREDCLGPERLVFYKDIPWKAIHPYNKADC